MDDYILTKGNIGEFICQISSELEEHGEMKLKISQNNIGKWGMARLWRSWMSIIADHMAANCVTMPLYIPDSGEPHGNRPFNSNDAHELFTYRFMPADKNGNRKSWAKSNDNAEVADKGERWFALMQVDEWAVEKGIALPHPAGSEFESLTNEMRR